MENLLDEVLEDLRVPDNIPVFHEGRAIFRKRVPLMYRAYVAAALAYRLTEGPRQGRNRPSKGHSEAGATAHPERPARAHNAPAAAHSPVQPRQNHAPDRTVAKTASRPAPDQKTVPVREDRYQGEGIVLFVSAGRRQRFNAKIVIKLLLDSGLVQKNQIGDIRTMDNYSFVTLDPAAETAALSILGAAEFKGRPLTVNRAKKKDEPAQDDWASEQVPDDDDGKDEIDQDTGSQI
jgi:hypothetical protein